MSSDIEHILVGRRNVEILGFRTAPDHVATLAIADSRRVKAELTA